MPPAIHERGRGYLDRMLNSTKRMQSLIEDLLRFAHVTSQARPFFPVDLAQVAREVISDLEVRILETKALVKLGALPTIDADAVQMRQLLESHRQCSEVPPTWSATGSTRIRGKL